MESSLVVRRLAPFAGTWTLGSTPGWMSPNGNNLPEPLLLIIGGYTIIGYSLIFPVLAFLSKIRERWPAITKFQQAIIGVLCLIVLDTFFESTLLRTGVYAYPYGIREMKASTIYTPEDAIQCCITRPCYVHRTVPTH